MKTRVSAVLLAVFFAAVVLAPATAQAPTPPTPTPTGDILADTWSAEGTKIVAGIIGGLIGGVMITGLIVYYFQKLRDALERLFTALAVRLYFTVWGQRQLLRQYVAALDADIKRWASVRGAWLELDQVYTPLTLVARGDPSQPLAPRRLRGTQNDIEPTRALRDYGRLVITGEPGAGKTTLLRYLAYLFAHRRTLSGSRLGDIAARGLDGVEMKRSRAPGLWRRWRAWRQLPERIPVYLPLSRLVSRDQNQNLRLQDLEAYLADYVREKVDKNWAGAEAFVHDKLEQSQFVLLLDALDEINITAQLEPMARMIQAFAARWSNKQDGGSRDNWIIVASRPESFRMCSACLTTFRELRVQDLILQEVRDFIDRWFKNKKQPPEHARKLAELIERDERLRELTSNPLLLTFVAETYSYGGPLDAGRRVDLFRNIVDVRLRLWKKDVHFAFDLSVREAFLKRVGHQVIRSPQTVIPAKQFDGLVSDHLTRQRIDPQGPNPLAPPPPARDPLPTAAERFVYENTEGSGLLQKHPLGYDFVHKSLAQYFAAAELADARDGGAALLVELDKGELDRWGEVAVLFAGLTSGAADLIRRLIRRKPALAPDGLLLAARCLREATVRDDAAVNDELARAMLAAAPSADEPTRNEAVNLLLDLFARQPGRLAAYAQALAAERPDLIRLELAAGLLKNAPGYPELKERVAALLQAEAARAGADADTRRRSAAALSIVGGDEAVAPLLRALQDPDPAVRRQAALALPGLPHLRAQAAQGAVSRDILNALRSCYKADADPAARLAARDALLLLGRAKEFDLARIPAGEFLMGTSAQQRADMKARFGWEYDWVGREMPQRKVMLEEFFIDRAPVTNAQFKAFVDASGYQTAAERDPKGGWIKLQGEYWKQVPGASWRRPRGPKSDIQDILDHPVVLVTWDDAVAYAQWAGKVLPTEAQWEKAARGGLSPLPMGEGAGGEGRLWPWGDDWDAARCNTAARLMGKDLPTPDEWDDWYKSFDVVKYGRAPTTPVGSFPGGASPFGALDCAGNVWEWTADWYKPYPGSEHKDERFGETYRVVRGGAWGYHPIYARVAARGDGTPSYADLNRGFRCVVLAPVIL